MRSTSGEETGVDAVLAVLNSAVVNL